MSTGITVRIGQGDAADIYTIRSLIAAAGSLAGAAEASDGAAVNADRRAGEAMREALSAEAEARKLRMEREPHEAYRGRSREADETLARFDQRICEADGQAESARQRAAACEAQAAALRLDAERWRAHAWACRHGFILCGVKRPAVDGRLREYVHVASEALAAGLGIDG